MKTDHDSNCKKDKTLFQFWKEMLFFLM